MNGSVTANIIFDIFSIVILGTIFIGCYLDRQNQKNSGTNIFDTMILMAVIRSILELVSWIVEGKVRYQVLSFITVLALTLCVYVQTQLFLHYLHGNFFGKRTLQFLRVLDTGAILYGIFIVIISCKGLSFTFADGYYTRGPLYVLIYLYPSAIMTGNLIVAILKKDVELRERISYMLFIIIPMMGGLMQLIMNGSSSYVIFDTITINIIYVNIYLGKSKKLARKQQELNENRMSMMLSQIQPHFLYNTITGIQELCLIEPQTASIALNKFGKFLRSNMDSLTTTECIPFHQELEHVRNYVYLEKMRYEKRLQVEFNIETEKFLIPSLSLQPIVENAIRHGISMKPGVPQHLKAFIKQRNLRYLPLLRRNTGNYLQKNRVFLKR